MNDKSKFEITREHLKIVTVATAAAALAFVIGRCVEKVSIAKDLIKVVVFWKKVIWRLKGCPV